MRSCSWPCLFEDLVLDGGQVPTNLGVELWVARFVHQREGVAHERRGETRAAGPPIDIGQAQRVGGSHRRLVELYEASGDVVEERLARFGVALGHRQESEALVDVPQIMRVVKLLDQGSGLRKNAGRTLVLLTHQVYVSEG